MDETKKIFYKKEIKENWLSCINECLNNSNLKEISFFDCNLKDEGCKIVVLLENKKIDNIDLSCKFKNNKR
jgi:hypothetical protein